MSCVSLKLPQTLGSTSEEREELGLQLWGSPCGRSPVEPQSQEGMLSSIFFRTETSYKIKNIFYFCVHLLIEKGSNLEF